MQLTFNPVITLLGLDHREVKTYVYTGKFLVALFVMTKSWQYPTCSFNGSMVKWTVVHTYHGILLSNQKEWQTDTYNVTESAENYAEQKANPKRLCTIGL